MKRPFTVNDYVVATKPGRNLVVGQLYRICGYSYQNYMVEGTSLDDSWEADHFYLATQEEINLAAAHPIP